MLWLNYPGWGTNNYSLYSSYKFYDCDRNYDSYLKQIRLELNTYYHQLNLQETITFAKSRKDHPANEGEYFRNYVVTNVLD